MRKPRYAKLLDKSVRAMLCAMEVYNKPNFAYREETFSILALNAWELLLKSKILYDNNNSLSAIYEYEKRNKKDGARSSRNYIKRNRAGNPQTIGLGRAIAYVDNSDKVDASIKSNLEGFIEVRDNAVHYLNVSIGLAHKVHELGTANVRNYLTLLKRWFDVDLSEFNFYLMPVGFLDNTETVKGTTVNSNEKNLIDHIEALSSSVEDNSGDFHVTVEVDVKFYKSGSVDAERVQISKDPSAPKVTLSEEDIRQKYPWDYNKLSDKLRDKYTDFKANKKFHDIRKSLMQDERYVKSRYLDPENPNGTKKDFYNPNIIQVFDNHYIKRKA